MKVFVITGTSRGIGKNIAEYFLLQGNVVAGCSRSVAQLNHENYLHYQFDISDEKAIVSMVRDLYKKFGKIDVLINNAGIASMNHIFLTPLSTVKKIFETNFIGSFLFMREVGKIMVLRNYGRIINFSSIAAPMLLEGEAIYAASKSAIESLTKISAKEFSEKNITVNAIGPTPIKTDLIQGVPVEKINELISKQTIKRFGEFTDVTNVLDFFIKPESHFITGQVIYLGGIFS